MTPSAPKSARPFPSALARRLLPFLHWLPLVNRATLRADLFAGLTGAFIVLPQGVAFAMIAGLPPEFGIYTAIVTPVVAALFGSSRHLVSGPTTAISIIVFSTLNPFAEPGTAAYIQMALTVTLVLAVTFLGTLFSKVERRRKQGRHIFLCRLHHDVNDVLQHGGHLDVIGKDRVFSTDANAIAEIFERLDRGGMRCGARIFEECQSAEYVGDGEPS